MTEAGAIIPRNEIFTPDIQVIFDKIVRRSIRTELGEVFASAFKDDTNFDLEKANYILDIPPAVYYSDNNVLTVARNANTGEVDGFTFIEKRPNGTYYAAVTAVRKQNQGIGTELHNKTVAELKRRGGEILITHVSETGRYGRLIQRIHPTEPPTPEDTYGQTSNQTTLRIRL